MNNFKIFLLIVFAVISFSSATPNFVSVQTDLQYKASSAEIVRYEFIDGKWYIVTYDEDGRIVDREAQE